MSRGLGAALKPKEVVQQLDNYIVGQPDAKRAVAIALRNRWRRTQLSDDLKNEVCDKNHLSVHNICFVQYLMLLFLLCRYFPGDPKEYSDDRSDGLREN